VTCHTFWRECSCCRRQLHSRRVFWRIRGGPPGGAAGSAPAAVELGDSWQRGTDNPHDFIFWRIRKRIARMHTTHARINSLRHKHTPKTIAISRTTSAFPEPCSTTSKAGIMQSARTANTSCSTIVPRIICPCRLSISFLHRMCAFHSKSCVRSCKEKQGMYKSSARLGPTTSIHACICACAPCA
jgi:hypothetical protein